MPLDKDKFPLTRHSVLALVRSAEPEARALGWDALVRAYWKPTYKYLRLSWRADEETARDWTQEFFARALEKGFFERFDPARARFRTYLRVCLDGFVGHEREKSSREKRGGVSTTLSLDFERAEGELAGLEPIAPDHADDVFQREWMRSLFEIALHQLEAECRAADHAQDFALFQRYDLEAPERAKKLTYEGVAAEFGLSVAQVTNRLHATRARLRSIVLARLRELCASDDEFRAEARALLGADPS